MQPRGIYARDLSDPFRYVTGRDSINPIEHIYIASASAVARELYYVYIVYITHILYYTLSLLQQWEIAGRRVRKLSLSLCAARQRRSISPGARIYECFMLSAAAAAPVCTGCRRETCISALSLSLALCALSSAHA